MSVTFLYSVSIPALGLWGGISVDFHKEPLASFAGMKIRRFNDFGADERRLRATKSPYGTLTAF
jgi:hypothetical protein